MGARAPIDVVADGWYSSARVADVGVRAGVAHALVTVLPPHDVRRCAVRPTHFEDLALASRRTDRVALHYQVVADLGLHTRHPFHLLAARGPSRGPLKAP